MTIEEFRNKIIEEICERKGEDYEVTAYDSLKNNGIKLHGINVRKKGYSAAPTIYIDDYYKNSSFEHIIELIIDAINNEEISEDFDCDFFVNFEKVKDNLFIKLINTDKNKELLEGVPNKEFLDLSMIVYCDISKELKINATITIRNEHLAGWKVTSENLIETAYQNTRSKKCIIRDILNVLPKDKIKDDNLISQESGSMYVMSNENMFWGSCCMTFDDVLDNFLEENEYKGVYIIPSSIHEVILLPKDIVGDDITYMNSIIKCVNSNELIEEEILSEHAYYYDSFEGYISVG